MIALFWTAVSVVGLFVYATIGVAVQRLFVAHDSAEWRGSPVGLVWPLTLAIYILFASISVGAKGPTAWGTSIADHVTGRTNKKEKLKAALKDSGTHIAELERQLGIGES